jgi:hypothetical protein
MCVEAAKRGKAIYCEKPMAITLSDCKQIREAVEKAGVKYLIGYHRRLNPLYQYAKKLLDEGIVPAQQVESLASAADAADAVVLSDEAAIKTAELNLDYCTIRSPLNGRTGTIMVKPGNLVKVVDVPIVVVNQVNPMYVNFTVPQQYLPEIREEFGLGKFIAETLVPGEADTWVAVPAFDEAPGIGATLGALRGQTLRPLVVCVVDNASTDRTPDIVREAAPAVSR